MTAPIQFIVLKYKGKWSIKSRDLHRFFSMQREAIDAAIRLANESGKEASLRWFYSRNRKPSFRRFGHTARATIPRPDRICPQCRGRLSWQNWRTPSVKAITLARNALSNRNRESQSSFHYSRATAVTNDPSALA